MGEIPQYYVEGHHEPIIEPDVFDLAQAELERRRGTEGYSGGSIFSSKIKCGDCGSWYGSKVWHSNDKYRRVIFRCNSKYKDHKCSTPHLTEDGIKDIFVRAFNEYFTEKDELLANMDIIIQMLCGTEELEEQARETLDEINVLMEMTNDLIEQNARIAQNQEDYKERYDSVVGRYEAKKKEYDSLQELIARKNAKAEILRQHKACLESVDGAITEFDGTLWAGLVDFITVNGKEDIVVTFKGGTEVKV